jgi:hypothetical protein
MLAMLALVELPAGPMRLRTASSGVVSAGRCHTVAVGGEGARGAPVWTELKSSGHTHQELAYACLLGIARPALACSPCLCPEQACAQLACTPACMHPTVPEPKHACAP